MFVLITLIFRSRTSFPGGNMTPFPLKYDIISYLFYEREQRIVFTLFLSLIPWQDFRCDMKLYPVEEETECLIMVYFLFCIQFFYKLICLIFYSTNCCYLWNVTYERPFETSVLVLYFSDCCQVLSLVVSLSLESLQKIIKLDVNLSR